MTRRGFHLSVRGYPANAYTRIIGYEAPQEAEDARGEATRSVAVLLGYLPDRDQARAHLVAAKKKQQPLPRNRKGGNPQGVNKMAVLDYLYMRCDELGKIIGSARGTEREEAKKERAFLEGQLRIAYGDSQWRAKLDPTVVESVRVGSLRVSGSDPNESLATRTRKSTAAPMTQKSATAPVRKPSYLKECEAMTFRELREFLDDSLRESFGGASGDRPRSKKEFLNLCRMLQGKINEFDLPAIPPYPVEPEVPPLAPSERLKALLDQREQLRVALAEARSRSFNTKQSTKLRRKLKVVEQECNKVMNLEYAKHRDAHLRPYLKARDAYHRSVRQREEDARRIPQARSRIVERVRTDTERAFKFGSLAVPTQRLTWRVLPPGQLSVETVLEHYGRLQRINPHVVYEQERIRKAFSLGPNQCYVGTDEFEGYIVLTFAHTPKALLECPKYGNAIYILDSDWKRWSRMTKQELLANRSGDITRIIHRGDWFWRVQSQLGIR